jgi:hypothetical protein
MGSAFSTKTLYQFIATLESVFAIAILAFGIKTLVLYYNYTSIDEDDDDSLEEQPGAELYKSNGREFIQYAAIAAVGQSIIQIIAAILLVAKSKYSHRIDRKDIHPGLVPQLWILHSIIALGLQLAVFLTPTLLYYTAKDPMDMQKTLKEFYTYSLVSAFFKIFFIWGVYLTLNSPKELPHDDDPELIHHSRKGSGAGKIEED